MNYEEFKQEFLQEVKDVFEEKGVNVEVESVQYDTVNKTVDGTVLRMEGASIAPTLHTDSLYERWTESDMSVREFAENVAESIEDEYAKIDQMDFKASDFNAEFIKENSYLSVVNAEWNEELLSHIPHEQIDGTDLAAFIKVEVEEGATITITNEHLSMLQMTPSEVIEMARENTLSQEFSVRSMEDVVRDLVPEDVMEELNLFPEMEHPSMLVITNESGFEGANAILSKETLDMACEKLGTDDITLIPSSRHELLAVDADTLGIDSTSEIKEMVEAVNGSSVSLEDQLSNNIYHYNGPSHELEMCNEEGIFLQEQGEEVEMTTSFGMNMGGQ